METQTQPKLSDFLSLRLKEKKTAREFQERRHQAWNEIYDLYRNKVKTNRLTQRQAVNIPLLKETVKTLLSKIDDPPTVDWKEKSGDDMKKLVYQAMWDNNFKKDKYEIKDILDKKCVLLYGISTKMLNVTNEGVTVNILDPYDVIFDPTTDPINMDSARFIIRQNLFRSLREILVDERYTEEGKEALKQWSLNPTGILQSGENKDEWEKKLQRIKDMGVTSTEFPTWAGGDMIVSLVEHYYLKWTGAKFEKYVCTYAQDSIELLDEKLSDLIGIEEWPFIIWSEDMQGNDIYADGIGDLVLTPNKVINIWFSQQAENRTLRNFQMHWYDASIQGYKPQTYEPGPGMMLPAPGDPNKTIKPVDISGLDETLTAIQFLTQIVERGTGATAIEKGVADKGAQTLGEVQILTQNAMERATTMSKFYRASWYELAYKWDLMMQGNSFKKISLYKTGRSGKMYEKIVYSKDWKSEAGYEPTVRSSSEQEQEQTKTIQKFMFVLSQFPNNPALKKIAQKRELEALDLTPDELKQVEDAEDQIQQQIERQQMMQMQQEQPQPPNQPQQTNQPIPQVNPQAEEIAGMLGQLGA
jgi:hypothetical protein